MSKWKFVASKEFAKINQNLVKSAYKLLQFQLHMATNESYRH